MVQVRGRKWASGADVWDRQERQPSLKATVKQRSHDNRGASSSHSRGVFSSLPLLSGDCLL
jgi:hypothetical protein